MTSAVNATKTLQIAMATAMLSKPGKVARAMKLIDTGGAGKLQVAQGAMGGEPQTLSPTATDVSLSDYFTFMTEYTTAHKVLKHKLPKSTVRGDAGFEEAGAQLAVALRTFIDKTGFNGLESLFGLAHPRAGTGGGQVGSGKKFLDTGLKYLQGESGEGTQDNLLTGALSETSLNAAIKLLLKQRNDRGAPLDIGSDGGLVLVVSPKNVQLAHELVKSQLSGSDMASNFVAGIVSEVVTWDFVTDDDDWFLIDPTACPCGIAWDAAETDVRVTETSDELFYEFIMEVKLVFFVAPYEYGIIGANVA